MNLIQSEPWMQSAACRGMDPNWWHPEQGQDTQQARRICRTCPVREPCLQYAVDNSIIHGIWGGLTIRRRYHLPHTPSTIGWRPDVRHGTHEGYREHRRLDTPQCQYCLDAYARYTQHARPTRAAS